MDTEIYSVATQLFATRGYANTSLQDIAQTLGLSRPALYHYISSKEDILAKLFVEFTESKANEYAGIIADAALDPAEKLRRMIGSTVRSIAEHPQRFRVLDQCENDLPDKLMKKHRAGKRAVRDAFITVIGEGHACGQFRQVDPARTAFALIGMCTWVAWWFTSTETTEVEATVRGITDLALHAVIADDVSAFSATPQGSINALRRQIDHLEALLPKG
jgi:AcrR family transcriptional regulator